MIVRNINGTSEANCKCGSWIEHWRRYSRWGDFSYCAVVGCIKKSTLGAHVRKDDATDRAWYIVPVCDEHNAQTESLEIGDNIPLVSANVSKTCGKA